MAPQQNQAHLKPHYIEVTSLRWRLVERSRQSWSSLSVAVLSLGAWLLLARSQNSSLCWAMGPLALAAGLVWMLAQHSIRRIGQRLAELGEPDDSMTFQPPPEGSSLCTSTYFLPRPAGSFGSRVHGSGLALVAEPAGRPR